MTHASYLDELAGSRFLTELFFYTEEEEILEVRVLEPAAHPAIPESLVHTIWKTQNFDTATLHTRQGETIHVVAPGRLNAGQGPDFLDARIVIGGVDWRGDVEIHVSSRAWYDHRHHLDPRYNSTILHCSLFADGRTATLQRQDGSVLPELVLQPHLRHSLKTLLRKPQASDAPYLVCRPLLNDEMAPVARAVLENQAAERLQDKKRRVEKAYMKTPDLEAILQRLLFAGLGYRENTEAMLELACRVPPGLALAYEEDLDLEALFLGVSGLIPDAEKQAPADPAAAEYLTNLRNRFERIQVRNGIPVMSPHMWRFFRLRPANFPTVRIAQAAALFHGNDLFRRGAVAAIERAFFSSHPLQHLKTLFHASPSRFWATHYRFETLTAKRNPVVGRQRFLQLVINAVIPVMLVYAELSDQPALEERVTSMLHAIPPESDRITQLFRAAGFALENAYISQGAHRLYRSSCAPHRCLQCQIGRQIIQKPR